jgi:hypothetical protein
LDLYYIAGEGGGDRFKVNHGTGMSHDNLFHKPYDLAKGGD